jgi:hypothetical protein
VPQFSAAGLRDHRAGRPDARAWHQTGVDGALQAEARAGHVADAGEPTHQCPLGLGRREQVEVSDIGAEGDVEADRGEHDVVVRVDQARHERAATAVDRLDVDLH